MKDIYYATCTTKSHEKSKLNCINQVTLGIQPIMEGKGHVLWALYSSYHNFAVDSKRQTHFLESYFSALTYTSYAKSICSTS